jgi:hypothetical protein
MKQNKATISRFSKLLKDLLKKYHCDYSGRIPYMGFRATGNILGLDYTTAIYVYLSPNILISEYKDYVVFALDLKNPDTVVQKNRGDAMDYFKDIKTYRKYFTGLKELEDELGKGVDEIDFKEFYRSDFFDEEIDGEIEDCVSDVKLKLYNSEFPFVKDRDTLPICWFDVSDEELYGHYCYSQYPSTWKSQTSKINLTLTNLNDYKDLAVPISPVEVRVNGKEVDEFLF